MDPTLAFRTPIWSDYLGLAHDSILTGVGTSGVNQYLADSATAQPEKIVYSHGHSIYIDGLTRYGIFWLILTLAVFAVAFYAVWKARNGFLGSRGLALVTFIFFAGLTETIFSWAYVYIYLLALILVVGLACDSERTPNSSVDEKAEGLRN
jgi:O-antigen ligase